MTKIKSHNSIYFSRVFSGVEGLIDRPTFKPRPLIILIDSLILVSASICMVSISAPALAKGSSHLFAGIVIK